MTHGTRILPRLARGGDPRPRGGVPLRRLPARGHRRREARLPRRRRRRERADRPRAADAERRRRAAPLRLEPLQLRLPWTRPLAPDRPGLPLLADPRRRRRRRPPPAADREGHRTRGPVARDRPDAPAHRPLHARRQHRDQHARRRRRQRRLRLRGPGRADVRDQGPLGGRRPAPAAQLRLLVPAAPERAGVVRVRRARRLRAGLRPRRRRRRALRQPPALLEPERAPGRADARAGRHRDGAAGDPLAARPRRRRGLRRRRAVEHDVAFPAHRRLVLGGAGDRGRPRRAARAGRSPSRG